MKLEKMTQKTNEAIEIAQKMAIKYSHQQIGGEHLHYGLIAVEESLILKVLAYMKVDLTQYRNQLITELERMPAVHGDDVQIYGSRRFNKLLIEAEEEAEKFSDHYISLEHVYISLLKEKNNFTKNLMNQYDIDLEKFLQALKILRADNRVDSQNPEVSLKNV